MPDTVVVTQNGSQAVVTVQAPPTVVVMPNPATQRFVEVNVGIMGPPGPPGPPGEASEASQAAIDSTLDVQARIWVAGTTEPTTWLTSGTVTGSFSGKVMLSAEGGSTGAAAACDFDDLSVTAT